MKNILFIGAGSMAEAIIHGLTAQQVIDAAHIFVTNKSNEAKLTQLHEAYGISATYELADALQQADLVVLAMKMSKRHLKKSRHIFQHRRLYYQSWRVMRWHRLKPF